MQIEHEVGQCPLHARAQVPINSESRAGEFRRALQVKHSELLSKLPVRLGGKVEFRRRAPAADLNVVFGPLAYGHTLVRNIGDSSKNFAQADFQLICNLFFLLNLFAQLLGLRHLRACICPAFLSFAISSEA